jgi:hypothetical protein
MPKRGESKIGRREERGRFSGTVLLSITLSGFQTTFISSSPRIRFRICYNFHVNLLTLRLLNQRLIDKKFAKPEDVVRYFGAVQSQDYAAAKWSLGLRLENATDETIEQALNEGRILRTHVLRPTWHFVSPEDVRGFLDLTAPRIKRFTTYYANKLGLTEAVFKQTNKIITKALIEHIYLTRQEIKTVLSGEGIETDVPRLGHIVANAEIDCIITSGPRRGKESTYALLEKRVPQTRTLTKDESLARLTKKYFTSHGPAQIKDFAWWSGLSVKDATNGVDMIRSKLESVKIDDKIYLCSPEQEYHQTDRQNVFLLSVYDEYFISYADRSDIFDEKYKRKLPIGNALLTSLIIIDGKVSGTWKRTIDRQGIKVKLFPFEKLSEQNADTIQKIVKDYGRFFGLPAEILKP